MVRAGGTRGLSREWLTSASIIHHITSVHTL